MANETDSSAEVTPKTDKNKSAEMGNIATAPCNKSAQANAPVNAHTKIDAASNKTAVASMSGIRECLSDEKCLAYVDAIAAITLILVTEDNNNDTLQDRLTAKIVGMSAEEIIELAKRI